MQKLTRGQNRALDKSEIGILLSRDRLMIFSDNVRMPQWVSGPFYRPGVERDDVTVAHVLPGLAFVIQFRGVGST